MQQRQQQHQEPERGEDGTLRLATPADIRTTEPRDALHERNEAEEPGEPAHRPKRSAIEVAVLGLVLLVLVGADAGNEGQRLTVATAILLGAVQGLAEFLPISSSGHLALGQAWLGIDPSTAGHRFIIAVHLGTLIAVIWVYRADVIGLLKVLAKPHVPSQERTMLLMMLLASAPLAMFLVPGMLDRVVAMESNVRGIGIALWFTALILFVSFRGGRGEGDPSPEPPKAWQAILIGLAQCVAVLPGVSRSGTTIAAGLGVGLDRAAAARFSFLISLIAVAGASAKEALDVITGDAAADPIDPLPYAAGFVASLVFGLLSLRGLLYLVGRGRIGVFVVYLIVVGGIAIFVG
jgi:undecaprenyl-diphosphatase